MLTLPSKTTSVKQFKFCFRVDIPFRSYCNSETAAAKGTGTVRGAETTATLSVKN